MRTTTTFDGAIYALVRINTEALTGVVALHEEVSGPISPPGMLNVHGHPCAHPPQVLDLFGEDDWRNVYAGELEV
jgi:hypothetical protein